MIVPGGKVTMFFAMLMFGEPGAEIMYPDPGFPIYRSLIEFTGRDAGADRAAREPRASPSRPTRCWRRSRRARGC